MNTNIVLVWLTFLLGSTSSSRGLTAKRSLMTKKDAPVVCVENAIQASTVQNGYFNRRAFMDFVERHSNDAINVVEFQNLDIALVHIYWQTICSYDSENCTITDEVPIDNLLQTISRDGISLVDGMCHRINLYLFGTLLTFSPTASPTKSPSLEPSHTPSTIPSRLPSVSPSVEPSLYPTRLPTNVPSKVPSISPTLQPSVLPSVDPTPQPTQEPSQMPTTTPSRVPTIKPTRSPTTVPSQSPTIKPSQSPTVMPSQRATTIPSQSPTTMPTQSPTIKPSQVPTPKVSQVPTRTPSMMPTVSQFPSTMPSVQFSSNPSQSPTKTSSQEPSGLPSGVPSSIPSYSSIPSMQPSWGESFTLTFSMETVRDPNTRMTLSNALDSCIRNGFTKQIISIDEACSRNDEQCPYSWQISVDLTPYQCFEGIDADSNECILADFTVAIRSYEMLLDEYEILKSKLSNAMRGYIRNELDSCVRESMYGDQ